jgi:hypothetical protein
MATTYNEIFDTTHEDYDKIINRLKYGLVSQLDYDVILDYLHNETDDTRLAVWAEVQSYKDEIGYHGDDLVEDIAGWKNRTLCNTFAQKFGWDIEQLTFIMADIPV